MKANLARYRRTVAYAIGALSCAMAVSACAPAQAQTRLRAHYTISMTGVSVGQIAWLSAIGDQRYTTSANGKASGVLSVLVDGEGSVDARGFVADGRLVPRFFVSTVTDDEGKAELRMTFDDGAVKELVAPRPPPGSDRVPVKDADLRSVADPLSAMLISAGDDKLAPANCNHVLSIFDGQRRYDLALSYRRVDKVAIERSYSGRVLV
jgi:hypothetical protein